RPAVAGARGGGDSGPVDRRGERGRRGRGAVMVVAETAFALSYFGKLPSRGDFVRTPENHQLMVMLDRWAGGGLELLATDPGWKQLYDEAPPLHFAFLGSRSKL